MHEVANLLITRSEETWDAPTHGAVEARPIGASNCHEVRAEAAVVSRACHGERSRAWGVVLLNAVTYRSQDRTGRLCILQVAMAEVVLVAVAASSSALVVQAAAPRLVTPRRRCTANKWQTGRPRQKKTRIAAQSRSWTLRQDTRDELTAARRLPSWFTKQPHKWAIAARGRLARSTMVHG